jgi:short-subunit dehydrogenase
LSKKSDWKICWITGATGGIGREIALLLAKRGIKVAATARSKDKLAELANQNSAISAFPADVTDANALGEVAQQIEKQLGPIDLVIPSAGVYAPFNVAELDLEGIHRTNAVNIDGVVNTLAAALPFMLARHNGQIAIMGSLFGYTGLPESGSYGASKAYMINLAEGLELDLAPKGIAVSLINPGFVDTALNADYDRPKYFIMKPTKAARRIVEGLDKGGFEVAFPGRVAVFFKAIRVLPKRLMFWILRTGFARD